MSKIIDFAAIKRAKLRAIPCECCGSTERDYAMTALRLAEDAIAAGTVTGYDAAAVEIDGLAELCDPDIWTPIARLAESMRIRADRTELTLKARRARRRHEALLASLEECDGD